MANGNGQQLPNAQIDQLPQYTAVKPGFFVAMKNMDNNITERLDIGELLKGSETTQNFEWITDNPPGYALNEVVTYGGKWWQSKIDNNLNNVPGVDPTKWGEVNKSDSGLVMWKAGVYPQDEAIVMNPVEPGSKILQLYRLDPDLPRPFTSINFETEKAAGQWIAFAGGSGGGGSGILERVWRFNTLTVGDPGAGNFRVNNVAIGSVTEIYFAESSRNNFDASVLFSLLATGYRIIIQQADDSTRIAEFELSGNPIDNGTWQTLPVTVIDHGGVMFENNKDCVVFFDLSKPAPVVPDATETAKGIVELSEQSEAEAAASSANVTTINDITAITPKKLRQFYAKVYEILTTTLAGSVLAIECLNRRESIYQYTATINHTINLLNEATLSGLHVHALLSNTVVIGFNINGAAANFIAAKDELPINATWDDVNNQLSIIGGTSSHWELNITRVNFSGTDYYKIKVSGPAI